MSNINKFVFTVVVVFALNLSAVFSETDGAALFRANKPMEAIPILEQEIASGNAEIENYNFLGLAYYQTGDWEKSLQAFEIGLDVPGTNKRILAYNAGNTAYASENYEKAEEYYSLALLADPAFKEAALNRANARFMQDNLYGAVEDYQTFVTVAPDDENTPRVQEMILLLDAEIKLREETARLAAELEKRREEEERRRMTELVSDTVPPPQQAEITGENISERVADTTPPPQQAEITGENVLERVSDTVPPPQQVQPQKFDDAAKNVSERVNAKDNVLPELPKERVIIQDVPENFFEPITDKAPPELPLSDFFKNNADVKRKSPLPSEPIPFE